jgi:hypothetical protein
MKLKIFTMVIIIFSVVFWIDNRIENQDMLFYSGKDNGFFARFISVTLLSAVFYYVMAKRQKWLMFIVGFFVGLISSLISYGIWFIYLDDFGLSCQIIACFLFVFIYLLVKYFNSSHFV